MCSRAEQSGGRDPGEPAWAAGAGPGAGCSRHLHLSLTARILLSRCFFLTKPEVFGEMADSWALVPESKGLTG